MKHLSSKGFLKAALTAILALTATMASAMYITATYNTFGTYDFTGKHFYIIPADPEISPKDLEFKEYAQFVSALFKSSGAIEAQDPALAEVCVMINYRLTDHSYVEVVPVPIRDVVGKVLKTEHTPDRGVVTTAENIYGTVGYEDKVKEVRDFRRVLNIYAFDNLDYEDDPDMLWKCNIISDGSTNSLQYALPAMVYQIINHAGERISKTASVTIDAEWGGYKAFMKAMDNYPNALFPFFTMEPNARINYIVRDRNLFRVTVREAGPGKRYIAKDTYLWADGISYPLVSVEYAKWDGTTRFKKDEVSFYNLIFQGVPEDVKTFDIVSPDKFEWRGIIAEP